MIPFHVKEEDKPMIDMNIKKFGIFKYFGKKACLNVLHQ